VGNFLHPCIAVTRFLLLQHRVLHILKLENPLLEMIAIILHFFPGESSGRSNQFVRDQEKWDENKES